MKIRTLVTLTLASIALSSVSSAAGVRVLYYASEPLAVSQAGLNDLLGADVRFDLAHSYVTSTNEVVSLATMLSYDVVFADANYPPAYTGDDLANYVDAGGKLVVATFLGGWEADETFMPGAFGGLGYNPMSSPTLDAFGARTMDISSVLVGSPIMTGVTSLSSSTYNGDYTTLSPGATLVAAWDDGRPMVAMNASMSITAISLLPNVYTYGHATGDYRQLFGNALAHSAAVPEPASMAVLGLGLAALKRRRSVKK